MLFPNVSFTVGKCYKKQSSLFRLLIYEPPAEAAAFETNWKSLYTNSAI